MPRADPPVMKAAVAAITAAWTYLWRGFLGTKARLEAVTPGVWVELLLLTSDCTKLAEETTTLPALPRSFGKRSPTQVCSKPPNGDHAGTRTTREGSPCGKQRKYLRLLVGKPNSSSQRSAGAQRDPGVPLCVPWRGASGRRERLGGGGWRWSSVWVTGSVLAVGKRHGTGRSSRGDLRAEETLAGRGSELSLLAGRSAPDHLCQNRPGATALLLETPLVN